MVAERGQSELWSVMKSDCLLSDHVVQGGLWSGYPVTNLLCCSVSVVRISQRIQAIQFSIILWYSGDAFKVDKLFYFMNANPYTHTHAHTLWLYDRKAAVFYAHCSKLKFIVPRILNFNSKLLFVRPQLFSCPKVFIQYNGMFFRKCNNKLILQLRILPLFWDHFFSLVMTGGNTFDNKKNNTLMQNHACRAVYKYCSLLSS